MQNNQETWEKLYNENPGIYPLPSTDERVIIDKYGICYTDLNDNIMKPYSGIEQKKWRVQVREAEEWLTDNTKLTPLLSAISIKCHIPLLDIAVKVQQNDNKMRKAIDGLLINKIDTGGL